jgi:chromosomal replication initiator protein
MAILRKKAKTRCVEVPEEVIRFAASRITSNIRELEGALNRLDALSLAKSSVINLELAREALGDGPGRPVRISTVLEVVAERFGIKVSDLQGKRRSKAVTHPRHVGMYLARLLTNHSLDEIGAYLGGRDHSTVVHAHRTITEMARRDVEFRGLLDEIAASVKNVAV